MDGKDEYEQSKQIFHALTAFFLGMIPSSVYGQFVTISNPPTIHSHWPDCHHARRPKTNAMIASGACIANPRL
jgi:heme A synthase